VRCVFLLAFEDTVALPAACEPPSTVVLGVQLHINRCCSPQLPLALPTIADLREPKHFQATTARDNYQWLSESGIYRRIGSESLENHIESEEQDKRRRTPRWMDHTTRGAVSSRVSLPRFDTRKPSCNQESICASCAVTVISREISSTDDSFSWFSLELVPHDHRDSTDKCTLPSRESVRELSFLMDVRTPCRPEMNLLPVCVYPNANTTTATTITKPATDAANPRSPLHDPVMYDLFCPPPPPPDKSTAKFVKWLVEPQICVELLIVRYLSSHCQRPLESM